MKSCGRIVAHVFDHSHKPHDGENLWFSIGVVAELFTRVGHGHSYFSTQQQRPRTRFCWLRFSLQRESVAEGSKSGATATDTPGLKIPSSAASACDYRPQPVRITAHCRVSPVLLTCCGCKWVSLRYLQRLSNGFLTLPWPGDGIGAWLEAAAPSQPHHLSAGRILPQKALPSQS